MMKIYIDSDFKCHVSDDGTMISAETDFFDGKCAAYIEGYKFIPSGHTMVREDGVEVVGEVIFPWKPWDELDAAQREYERAELADMRNALAIRGVTLDE